MRSESGWYCMKIDGKFVCMIFDEYLENGWDIELTKEMT